MPTGVQYPQLHDSSWVANTVSGLDPEEAIEHLIELLGCSPNLAQAGLRRAGIFTTPPFSEIEDSVLRQFYPSFEARLVALALGRTKSSVFSRANRIAIRKEQGSPRSHARKEGQERVFWNQWRAWLVSRWDVWLRRGFWAEALHFVVCPAQPREDCGAHCPMWNHCVHARKHLLPCERVTVGDILFDSPDN